MFAREWPSPWQAIPRAERARYEDQLRRELTAGHPLHGVPATALARGLGNAVLFGLEGQERPLAAVELTWEGPQRYPRPDTRLLDSLADL